MDEVKIQVTKLPGKNTLIIRQIGKPSFFVSAYNVISIEVSALAFLIKFLIQGGFMDKKVIEGILSELSE